MRHASRLSALTLIAATAFLLISCKPVVIDDDRPETSRAFPRAERPVSEVIGNQWSTEEARDKANEANDVMDRATIKPGMTVADIGAGEGYYTVRLAERVGAEGRVLAQDISSDAIERLGTRVNRERLDNVSIKLGAIDDPRLPEGSFDRIFLVHMYHEVTEPYAFLWRLLPALKEGGQVIVVDADLPTKDHGMPPKLLFCEFESIGYKLVGFEKKPSVGGYFARFEATKNRPAPSKIKACTSKTK